MDTDDTDLIPALEDTAPRRRTTRDDRIDAIGAIHSHRPATLDDDDLFDASYNPDTDAPTERGLKTHVPKRPRQSQTEKAPPKTVKRVVQAPKVNILHTLTRKAPATGGGEAFAMPAESEDADERVRLLLQKDDDDDVMGRDDDDEGDMDINAILFGKAGPPPPPPPPPEEVPPPPPLPQVSIKTKKEETKPAIPKNPTDRNFAAKASKTKSHDEVAVVVPDLTETFENIEEKVKFKVDGDGDGAPTDTSFVDMYWIDARELPGNPSAVFLMGKVKAPTGGWQSCCVIVTDLERSVLILPRDGCDFPSVAREVSALCASQGIDKRRLKPVQRWYAFEKDGVPNEKSLWVKLKYSAEKAPLRTNEGGHETFSHVMGANRSSLELLLIKRKIMGPCWVRIQNTTVSKPQMTYCAQEMIATGGHKSVRPLADSEHAYHCPPLVVISINIVTHLNEKQKANEIVAVGVVTMKAVDMDGPSNVATGQKTLWSCIRKIESGYVFPLHLGQFFTDKKLPSPKLVDSEKNLLEALMEKITQEDPDVLVGHNFLSFHLDVILHRMLVTKVNQWSRIGRLKLSVMPKLQSGAGGLTESSFAEREVLAGRMCCDTYVISKEYVKATSYSLASLSVQLNLTGMGVAASAVPDDGGEEEDGGGAPENSTVSLRSSFKTNATLYDMVIVCVDKCVQALSLAFHLDVIPMTKRMTSLAGNVWSKTLAGQRAERIEYLLLHKFHECKFVTPDKQGFKEKEKLAEDGEENEGGGKRKPKYLGGMVLEPKRGLYTDYVLLLDFNSLYPSIIQEFHVCFTTVTRPKPNAEGVVPPVQLPKVDTLICQECVSIGVLAAPCRHRDILPKVIKELVDSRRSVKQMLKSTKDEGKRAQLEIRQKALKLTANAMYGCLGFQHSRFYAQPLAELITQQGRDALSHAVELVPRIDPKLQVIYGDTDSVMINSGIADDLVAVRDVAEKVKAAVNKSYRTLEIDIDGVFRTMLLVRKKKYAALRVVDFMDKGLITQRDVKGLDVVRREWCAISKSISAFILDVILAPKTAATTSETDVIDTIVEFLRGKVAMMNDGSMRLEDYVIIKSLTKEPDAYANKVDHPHVIVSMRMRGRMEAVQVGDLIPHVICTHESAKCEASQTKLSYRAFHPSEVMAKDSTLSIDMQWYLTTQIYPPISRLLEHIQGCNLEMIAEVLGLDPKKVVTASSGGAPATHGVASSTNKTVSVGLDFQGPDVVFEHASHLFMPCSRPSCGATMDIIPYQHIHRHALQMTSKLQTDGTTGVDQNSTIPWMACPSCGHEVQWRWVMNAVTRECRAAQKKYYAHNSGCSLLWKGHGEEDQAMPAQTLREQYSYLRELFEKDHIERTVETKLSVYLRDFVPAEKMREMGAALRRATGIIVLNDPASMASCITRDVLDRTRSRFVVQFGKSVFMTPRAHEKVRPGATQQPNDPDAEDIFFELSDTVGKWQKSAPNEKVMLGTVFEGMGLKD